MATGLYNWSRTPATNASATYNMAEGMAPSAVNDGIRGLMSDAAQWRDDISGAIITGGSGTAYTVASYSAFDTLAHLSGQVVAFTVHTTNTGTSTLNVDGLGVKPLRSATGVDIFAGTLIAGTPYTCIYNNSDGVFYLHNFYGNPYSVPLGGMIDYTGLTAPNSSFILPQGQAINRTTYATYFALVSTTYGAGDGSTTFNVIDMVGRVGAMRDAGSARISSSYFGGNPATLGASGGSESHTLTTAQLAAHSHANALSDPGHVHNTFGGNSARLLGSFGTTGSPIVGAQLNNGDDGTMVTQSKATGMSIVNANAGGGTAHNNVQPTTIVQKLLRVL